MGIIVATIGTAFPEQSSVFYGIGVILVIFGIVIIIPAAKKYAH